MTTSVTSIYQQFKGLNGQPLENGYVYIGISGQNPETAPLSVYWDFEMTQPALQPLRTVNGFIYRTGTPANVFLASDYSETVRELDRSLVTTTLSAAAAGDFGAILQGPGGSSMVGFIAAGTGAVARTSQSKMRDWVSAFDFMTTAQITDIQTRAALIDVTTQLANAIAAAKFVFLPPGKYLANVVVGNQDCVLFSAYPHAATIKAADDAEDVIFFNRPTGQNGWQASVINIDTAGGLNSIHIYGGYCGAASCIENVTVRTPSGAGLLIDTDPADVSIGSTWIYGKVRNFRIEGAGAATGFGIKTVGYNMLNASGWDNISMAETNVGMSVTETVSTGVAVRFNSLTIEDTQEEAIANTGTNIIITDLYTEDVGIAVNTAEINLSSDDPGATFRAGLTLINPHFGAKGAASAANPNRVRFSTNYCTLNVYGAPAVGTFEIDGNNKTAGAFIYLFGFASGWTVNNFSNNEVRSEVFWRSVTFDAANFTGNGAMTWVLTSPDQVTLKYMLNGKTMTVAWFLTSTTVAGTPDFELRLKIPLSKVAASTIVNACHANDNAAGIAAYAEVAASGTNILIYRADNANWAAAANTTDIQGQITFEVQ